MEEGDNDNEVKLIQSGGGAPEHNVQMSSLIRTHTHLYTHLNAERHRQKHTHTFSLFSSVSRVQMFELFHLGTNCQITLTLHSYTQKNKSVSLFFCLLCWTSSCYWRVTGCWFESLFWFLKSLSRRKQEEKFTFF